MNNFLPSILSEGWLCCTKSILAYLIGLATMKTSQRDARTQGCRLVSVYKKKKSKKIHYSLLIRALKLEKKNGTKRNEGTFRIDKFV